MTLPFKLVSADSHIVEPPDLWTSRIDLAFRDRAPRIVEDDKGDYFVCEGSKRSGGGLGLLATRPKYDDPEHDFGFEGKWTDVVEAAYDPAARVAELDRLRAKRSDLDEMQWEQVDAITRSLVAKLLHQPTVALKEAAGTPRGERLVEALRALFDL